MLIAKIVISTDGIRAYCLFRAVRYYVEQKWRNLKAVAKKCQLRNNVTAHSIPSKQ